MIWSLALQAERRCTAMVDRLEVLAGQQRLDLLRAELPAVEAAVQLNGTPDLKNRLRRLRALLALRGGVA